MKNLFFVLIMVFSFFSCYDNVQYDGQFTIIKKMKHPQFPSIQVFDVVSVYGDTLKGVKTTKNLFLNSDIGHKVYVYTDMFTGDLKAKKEKDE